MNNVSAIIKQNLNRPNFSAEEFFISDTVYRINSDANPDNDFDNYPPKNLELGILPCLMNTADMMQELFNCLFAEYTRREIDAGRLKIGDKIVGFFVKINSAYRCKKLNDLVGSTDQSQHLQGLAVDFVCPRFGTPEQIVKFLHEKKFLVDQCFNEGSWVHISRKLVKSQNRMMIGYYLPDKTGKRKFKAL